MYMANGTWHTPLGTQLQLRSQPWHASIYSNTTEWINKRHRIFTTCEFMLTYCSIISKKKKVSIACARYVSLSLSLPTIQILYRHSITAIICTRCIRSRIFGLEFCITDSDAHIGVYYSSLLIDRYELLQWMVSALHRSHICDRITRST